MANFDTQIKQSQAQVAEAQAKISRITGQIEDRLTADVAGENQHRVGEIHRAPLAIGESAIIKHLQQDVEHLGVSLFDFV